MHAVYALVDPRDNKPRYIGITKDLHQRLIQHLRCDGTNYRKDAWIKDLQANHLMLRMDTLQVVTTALEATVQEAYWIHHYLMLKCDLYNDMIPTPLHLKDMTEQRKFAKYVMSSEAATLILHSETAKEAVLELRKQGRGKQFIIGHVWRVKPGASPRYKQAEAEYEAIVAEQEA